ncbi:MAG TPA: hypothetical protein VEU62_22790, partial [Bryobacterales bacterium]|nr:hypothetical protein [Bryobacterales bacterium]
LPYVGGVPTVKYVAQFCILAFVVLFSFGLYRAFQEHGSQPPEETLRRTILRNTSVRKFPGKDTVFLSYECNGATLYTFDADFDVLQPEAAVAEPRFHPALLISDATLAGWLGETSGVAQKDIAAAALTDPAAPQMDPGKLLLKYLSGYEIGYRVGGQVEPPCSSDAIKELLQTKNYRSGIKRAAYVSLVGDSFLAPDGENDRFIPLLSLKLASDHPRARSAEVTKKADPPSLHWTPADRDRLRKHLEDPAWDPKSPDFLEAINARDDLRRLARENPGELKSLMPGRRDARLLTSSDILLSAAR